MKRILIVLAIALIPTLAMSAAKAKGDVYSPSAGIMCDKKAGFCADSEGISLAYTKEYLGDEAEAKMTKSASDSNFDTTWFGFSNGVDCKAKEKVCHVNKHSDKVDKTTTKVLFGK